MNWVFLLYYSQNPVRKRWNRICAIMCHINRGMNSSIARQKVSHHKIILLLFILQTDSSNKFNCIYSERQRELKRISNMIDDIIATKWSRIAEKPVRFDTHFTVKRQRKWCYIYLRFFPLNEYAFTFQNKIFFIISSSASSHVLVRCQSVANNGPSGKKVKVRKKHKSQTNEEFLISLKMKEKR